jgi:hypothetical protein
VGADARLRQNLALAHALSGDWTAARTIAAQDLSADLVEARVREWMSLASPARAADQVAALTGIVPAASDPGQPVRLALRRSQTRHAEAAPAVAPTVPQVVAAPVPQVAVQAPKAVAVPPQPAVQLAAAPAAEPYYVSAPVPEAAPVAEFTPQPAAAPVALAQVRAPAPAPKAAKAAQRVAKLVAKRPAALPVRSGTSGAVVQLGAYGSPQRVAEAWTAASRRHALLRSYAPMSASFAGPKGMVYRLSVRGFGSAREAVQLCASLRRAGGTCFVRGVAGDAPVQIASR